MKKTRMLLSVILTAVILLTPFGLLSASAESGRWITSWASSMVDGSISVAGIKFNDIIPSGRTVRTELSVTAGGDMLRLCFSNEYGDAPITISQASVAKTGSAGRAQIKNGSSVVLTFNGEQSVTIPAGQRVWCDNFRFATAILDKLTVSTYYRSTVYMKTVGLSNGRTFMNTVSQNTGSQVKSEKLTAYSEMKLASGTVTLHTVPFLCEIETHSKSDSAATAVFIGDSTLVNDAWLYFSQRISSTGTTDIAVVNQSIIGNRLLSECSDRFIGSLYGESAEKRFKRDVLDLSGVKYCFIKIGLNDILHQYSKSLGAGAPKVSTTDIINGYLKLAQLCHENGIKVYFFTKSAWNGYTRPFLGQNDDLSWSEPAQNKCDVLSSWIRTTKSIDGYIDCSPLEDPSDTTRLCSSLTVDGAHLSRLGSIALADLIPLSYVGINKAGRTSAAINNVNPYAEKERILYYMEHPTTEPATTEKQQEAETPSAEKTTAETKKQEVPSTKRENDGGNTAQTTRAAIQPYTTVPAETTASAVAETTTTGYIMPETTRVEVLTRYIIPHTEATTEAISVDKIGGGAGTAFIFLLFLIIIVIGAVLMFTVARKKTPDITDVYENDSRISAAIEAAIAVSGTENDNQSPAQDVSFAKQDAINEAGPAAVADEDIPQDGV